MARETSDIVKASIFKRLNEEGLPWSDSRFVIENDEINFLGCGGFSHVVLMENVNNPELKYAVKVLGFMADKRIHQNDYDLYKKEAILQYRLASQCKTIVNIIDKAIVSVKLSDSGNVEEIKTDGSGADKFGWISLVFIKMEKLERIIADTITDDRYICLPELEDADDKTVLEFAIDIAEALNVSHKMNIMHRDVKLENVFYDKNSGKFKLGDYGIARITSHGSASTKGAGTKGYEAPEVGEESSEGDRYTYKADIYSFGVTVYVLLNNLRFPGSKTYHVERAVQYNPNGIIEKPEKGLPELQSLVGRCIQYYPKNRPESMEEVLSELYKIYKKYYGEGVDNDIDSVNQVEGSLLTEKISPVEKTPLVEKTTSVEKKPSIEKRPLETENMSQVTKKDDKSGAEKSIKKAEIATVVAEVEKTEEKIQKNETSLKSKNNNKTFKRDKGFALMLIGLLFLELIVVKEERVTYGLFTWVLSGASVIFSFASLINKKKRGQRLSYIFYFALMCFSIFAIYREGTVWPTVLLTVGLFIAGVTETCVVSLNTAIYPLVILLKNTGNVDWLCNESFIFICVFAIILGFFWLEQYDAQDDVTSVMFSETALMLVWSIIITVAGLILGALKLLSVIDQSSILIKMHFLYVGLALIVVSFIQIGKEYYGTEK